jgi:hypothetical protein
LAALLHVGRQGAHVATILDHGDRWRRLSRLGASYPAGSERTALPAAVRGEAPE